MGEMTNEEAIALLEDHMTFNRTMQRGWGNTMIETDAGNMVNGELYANQHKDVADALELAINALRAGGRDTNVPTMPAGQPLTLEQLRGMDGKPVWITDLLACAETSEERCKELEERCKRLNEARERANEAAHKWETMYRGKKEELEISQNEVSTMSMAGMEMLNAFSEYVRNGSKNPAAYCYFGAAGCGGDGDGCKGVSRCNFLPKSGMKGGEQQ